MKSLVSAFISLSIVLTLSVNAQVSSKGPLELTKPVALRKKVAAVPLTRNPKNAEERRINDDLRKVNSEMRAALSECDENFSVFREAMGAGDPDPPKQGDWSRVVTVTMAGPGYLSYQIADFNYCGGLIQIWTKRL